MKAVRMYILYDVFPGDDKDRFGCYCEGFTYVGSSHGNIPAIVKYGDGREIPINLVKVRQAKPPIRKFPTPSGLILLSEESSSKFPPEFLFRS